MNGPDTEVVVEPATDDIPVASLAAWRTAMSGRAAFLRFIGAPVAWMPSLAIRRDSEGRVYFLATIVERRWAQAMPGRINGFPVKLRLPDDSCEW